MKMPIIKSECRYMRKSCRCNRSMYDIRTIKCKCPELKNKQEWIKTRTKEKCSIPLDYPQEKGMQFCKYYEPIITNTSTINSNPHSSHAIK